MFLNTYYGSVRNANDREALPSQGFWARGRGKACQQTIRIQAGGCCEAGSVEQGGGSTDEAFQPLGSQGRLLRPEGWVKCPSPRLGRAFGIRKRVFSKNNTLCYEVAILCCIVLIILSSWGRRGLLDQKVGGWKGQSMRLEMLRNTL